MTIIGSKVIVLIVDVPTFVVIDVSVFIIINAIVGDFVFIHPFVVHQIGVVEVSSFNHTNHNFVASSSESSSSDVPSEIRINVFVVGLVVVPLVSVNRIVGGSFSLLYKMVELCQTNVVVHLHQAKKGVFVNGVGVEFKMPQVHGGTQLFDEFEFDVRITNGSKILKELVNLRVVFELNNQFSVGMFHLSQQIAAQHKSCKKCNNSHE